MRKIGRIISVIIFFIILIQLAGVILYSEKNDVIADVLIYTGPGAWGTGYRAFEKFLDYKNLTWFECNHNFINNNDLEGKFKVIHFPGGSPGEYSNSINLAGHKNIRDFVSSGGGYVGICAGGYFAADINIWEGNTYDIPLNLFSGTAYGAIDEIIPWPGYKMTNITINKSNPINLYEPISQTILYYGGAAFYPNEGQQINIIGTYDSLNNDPAIINLNYGDGRVLLFGPHPEIEEDSDRDGETTFHFLEDNGTDWNLLWTSMDWLMKREISEPPMSVQPDKPDIKGMLNGKNGIEYNYTIYTNDPDLDEVYYYIDWDDNSISDWFGPYKSGEIIQITHSWNKIGKYSVRAKARDMNNLESEWSDPLVISMPKNKINMNLIIWRFPLYKYLLSIIA